MKEIEFKDLIGKRVLIRRRHWIGGITETRVIEVSPNKKYVKLKIFSSKGSSYYEWRKAAKYEIVDVLGEIL